jgi:hypothetical protein
MANAQKVRDVIIFGQSLSYDSQNALLAKRFCIESAGAPSS